MVSAAAAEAASVAAAEVDSAAAECVAAVDLVASPQERWSVG